MRLFGTTIKGQKGVSEFSHYGCVNVAQPANKFSIIQSYISECPCHFVDVYSYASGMPVVSVENMINTLLSIL